MHTSTAGFMSVQPGQLHGTPCLKGSRALPKALLYFELLTFIFKLALQVKSDGPMEWCVGPRSPHNATVCSLFLAAVFACSIHDAP